MIYPYSVETTVNFFMPKAAKRFNDPIPRAGAGARVAGTSSGLPPVHRLRPSPGIQATPWFPAKGYPYGVPAIPD
jgi:hypothetical protein